MLQNKADNSNQNTYKFLEFSTIEKIIGAALIGFIIIGPWLFTRETLLGFDFETTGQIGDTIGGITAPFINILAAYLVYKSFNAQFKANKIQRENHLEQLTNQRDEHRQQMQMLFNEQSCTLLLNVYDMIFREFESIQQSESNASYSSLLHNALTLLNSSMNENDRAIKRDQKSVGIADLKRSIRVLNSFYSNCLSYCTMANSILKRTKDENVDSIASFTLLKIDSMFQSKRHNTILNFNVEELIKGNNINDDLAYEIRATNEAAHTLKSLLNILHERLFPDVSGYQFKHSKKDETS